MLLEVSVGRYLPWWGFMILPFVFSALMARSWRRALISGAAAVGLLWLTTAAYLNSVNEGILARRVAPLFSLPGPWALIAISALIGALTGGLAALAGFWFKSLVTDARR
ncbi:MAG: hypothetical protein RMM53_02535 [Bacteroidia bacterium]|nr:hypothetical protein [Bacteroidia bacterium]MDW8333073.1 hypothetical protein [Bacteroidia bacterium]